jgi:hypothetical protein
MPQNFELHCAFAQGNRLAERFPIYDLWVRPQAGMTTKRLCFEVPMISILY